MYNALIVDDESLVRKGLRMIFPWEKYKINIIGEAASGESALAFLRTQSVQLVITDITMPGMSGLELLKHVQAFDSTIKVVMLTCHQDFDYIQESLRLGAIDYIVKTQLEDHNLDEILQRIVKHIEIKPIAGVVKTANMTQLNQQIIERWSQVIWVVDDRIYEELIHDSVAISTDHIVDWSSIVASSFESWQLSFPVFTDWKTDGGLPTRLDQLLIWVKELRIELQRWLRKSQYSEDVIYAIVKSIDMIHENPAAHISQTELSKKVNISKSYFSTSFKEILGISFTHYLQRVAIERAKAMIENTNHPIYWIAEQCGFSDQRYFSKLFKEQTGILPSELRQNLHNR
ncbi:response regulator [Paenibacillus psychroresistens]|nr:response regulator [Paenibacillus psychroresistens]